MVDKVLRRGREVPGHLRKSPGTGAHRSCAAKIPMRGADFGPAGFDWPEWSSRRRFAHSRDFPIIFRRAAGAFPGILNLPGRETIEVSAPSSTASMCGGMVQMAKKGITGHDEWVFTEALATALIALEQLPVKHQPRTHMDDISKLLAARCQPGTVTLHLAQ